MTSALNQTLQQGKALTANRLTDGEVVFFSPAGTWSETIDEAVVAREPHSANALEQRGNEAVDANLITDPYLFDVERRNGQLRALHIRERIRALGPTVRADLGKQALGLGSAFAAAG